MKCPECNYLMARLQAEIDRCDLQLAEKKGRTAQASYRGERYAYEQALQWIRALKAIAEAPRSPEGTAHD